METPNWLTNVLKSMWDTVLQLQELNSLAFTFALLTPLLLIYGRHEIRVRRLRAIKDFLLSFDLLARERKSKAEQDAAAQANAIADGQAAADPLAQQAVGPRIVNVVQPADSPSDKLRHNPSFEFVKSKYISDIDPALIDGDKSIDGLSEIEQIDHIIKVAGHFGSSADRRMVLSAFGLIIVCYYGFDAFQQTVLCGFGLGDDRQLCPAPTNAGYGSYDQLRIIGSLTFIGAFVASIRIFLRGLAVFDLSTYTFLRQTAEIFASVALAMAIFRAFPDPLGQLAAAANLTSGSAPSGEIPWIWFASAPLFGLLPQSTTKFLLMKLQSLVQWVKTSDDRFIDVTKIISLDIIDGIDFETRFRLEECGIYDVQNLATYNPIMLHIESPYGIYQVIDWIGQAQLCHILGPEKFLIFREMNIRTIFDLERAISDENAPPEFDEICVSILFTPTANLRQTLTIAKTKFVITENDESKEVTLEEYSRWLQKRIATAGKSAATEHVMRWIADDLHVRRLRRLWKEISASLGVESFRLDTSKA